MLTPVDITNRVFKGGIGYDKKDVETFMAEFSADYRELYSSNVELKDKITTLNESLVHYRSIEDSMQKALTLSEKTAEETIAAANDKARQINIEAEVKAETLLADARKELQTIKDEIYRYRMMYSQYKAQFAKVLEAQQKALEVEVLDVELGSDFEPSANVLHSFYGLGMSYSDLSMGGGLGSGIGFGTYVGADPSMRTRTNQDPTFDRGSLNMDPFADAANGGGRFSKQTGGAYNGSGKKKSSKNSKNKTNLNVKDTKSTKVKRHVTAKNIQSNSGQDVTSTVNTTPVNNVTSTANTSPVNNFSSTANPSPVNNVATQTVSKEDVLNAINATQNTTSTDTFTVPTPNASVDTNTTYTTAQNTATGMNAAFTTAQNTATDTNAAFTTTSNTASDANNTSFSTDATNSDALNGEVENKQIKSRMIDSEDNYNEGFDFIAESTTTQFSYNPQPEIGEDTYVGEVEIRVNESNMINSNDNLDEGFNFIVDDLEEVEIPTIFPTPDINAFNNNVSVTDNTNEDVLVGNVEDKINKSTLIGNDDDNDDGFKFL